jgi:hypothetical protein
MADARECAAKGKESVARVGEVGKAGILSIPFFLF